MKINKFAIIGIFVIIFVAGMIMLRIITSKIIAGTIMSARSNALLKRRILMFEKTGNNTSFDVVRNTRLVKNGRNKTKTRVLIMNLPTNSI